MATLQTVSLGSMSPGLNNRLPDTQLGRTLPDRSRATFLYSADNVDLTGRGFLRRRRGFTLAQAGAAHSVWGDEQEGYCAIGSELVHLAATDSGPLQRTTVLTGLQEFRPISYERMPDGDVIWSNGQRIGRLRGAAALPLMTPRPAVVPAISLIAGSLPAGRYQVAFTALGPLGESGSTVPIALDVPQNGGIQIAGLGADTMVYMTGPNGSVFTGTFADGGQIVSLSNTGPHLRTLLLADMPPGQIVRHYLGSLLVACGRLLCISEPYLYGLTHATKRYIQFPAPITVMEPCESGVFVCADHTYWLAGGLDAAAPARVLPFGGLAGSGGRVPTPDGEAEPKQVFWLSPRGLVIGSATGAAVAVQEKALKFGGARSGATLFREQDGSNQILAARMEAARPVPVSDTYFPFENIVKGCSK